MSFITEDFHIKRSGMGAFIDGIVKNPGDTPLSVYIPQGTSLDEIADMAIPAIPDEIAGIAASSATGAVLFFAEDNYLALPPLPVPEKVIFPELDPEPLLSIVTADHVMGLVLVHLGSYAVGVCKGDSLVSSKVGTGLVHGRTRKGGSSSGRFQRRRQNQGREFLERVCERAREYLEPYRKTMDYIQYGGPKQTVLRLQQSCPFLQAFEDRKLPLMEVPPLKQKVLEASVRRMWSSRIIRWDEAQDEK